MVVDADKIDRCFAERVEEVLHCFDCRAGRHEVIKDDDILLFGYIVGSEYGIDALTSASRGTVIIERYAEPCAYFLGDE